MTSPVLFNPENVVQPFTFPDNPRLRTIHKWSGRTSLSHCEPPLGTIRSLRKCSRQNRIQWSLAVTLEPDSDRISRYISLRIVRSTLLVWKFHQLILMGRFQFFSLIFGILAFLFGVTSGTVVASNTLAIDNGSVTGTVQQ